MGLVTKIKKLFFKKSEERYKASSEKTIVPYDTSFIVLPEYNTLFEEDKKEVKCFQEEVDMNKIETIILYASNMSEKAGNEVNLLLKTYYKLTEKPTKKALSSMKLDDIHEVRFESVINQEVLKIYMEELVKLQREAILRAVAIHELIKKYPKRRIEFLSAFGLAEHIKKAQQMEALVSAEVRTKVAVKNIGDLIQIVRNSMASEEVLNSSIKLYDEVLEQDKEKESEVKENRKKVIHKKAERIVKQATTILGKETDGINLPEINQDERGVARQLARFQREIDLYAYTHQGEIEELKTKIEQLLGRVKNQIELLWDEPHSNNTEEKLKLVEKLEIKYEIFRQYIKPEYAEKLYTIKFDVLKDLIGADKDNPFDTISSSFEREIYCKIIGRKIEEIIKGKNTLFNGNFTEKYINAVTIFSQMLKSKGRDFLEDGVLQDKQFLEFVLAFGKSGGFLSFTKSKYFFTRELLYDGYVDLGLKTRSIFGWEEKISLATLYHVYNAMSDEEKKKLNRHKDIKLWMELTHLYPEFNYIRKEPDYIDLGGTERKSRYFFPEGITEMKYDTPMIEFEKNMMDAAKVCDNIYFPTTLREIGEKRFKGWDMEKVEFNEGLKQIHYGAFEDCKRLYILKFPKSLETIYTYAFKGCLGLKYIELQEGIQHVGEGAFDIGTTLTTLGVPSKEFECRGMFGSHNNLPWYKSVQLEVLKVMGDRVPRCVLDSLVYLNDPMINQFRYSCNKIGLVSEGIDAVISNGLTCSQTMADIEEMEKDFQDRLKEKNTIER